MHKRCEKWRDPDAPTPCRASIKKGIMNNTVRFLLATVMLISAPAWAAISPNPLFSCDAVLQQGQDVPIWGTARDGEKVTVSFAGQTATTTAKDGKWLVRLKALEASSTPQTMTLAGDNTITLTNLLVGEVWVCSGQSNMQLPLKKTAGSTEAIAAATDRQLRLFFVPRSIPDTLPAKVLTSWKVCSPRRATGFSAVAYYFGRDLRKARQVPVGLIHSSWGGSPAEAWTPRAVLETDPLLSAILPRWEGQNQLPRHNCPAILYNAMIAPLLPYAIKGVIWYQGESNNGHTKEYQTLFPAMVKSWRDAWGQGVFPFLFVQIAPFEGMTPELREAQLICWRNTPNTAMAVITDHGEAQNIHPLEKAPVGARLALAARALAYGESLVYSGPVYSSMTIQDSKAVLSFTHVGGGLVAKGGDLKGFTLAGADHVFIPATAVIKGNTVEVSASSVTQPVAVRYGWSNVPDVNLFNAEGLPATPFRTDEAAPLAEKPAK